MDIEQVRDEASEIRQSLKSVTEMLLLLDLRLQEMEAKAKDEIEDIRSLKVV